MGSQFIHANSYGRTAGKGKQSAHTVDSVALEADREDGNCYHVADPKKPVVLFGGTFKEAAEEAKKWAESTTDARGHKLRKDALCMVAGVISAPDDLTDWEKYKADSLDWLQKKYGNSLSSVMEHTDESHRHLHFAVVPEVGKSFESIHQGYAAQKGANPQRGKRDLEKGAKAAGRVEGIRAYQSAMRDYQSEFYEGVSKKHGLTRIGPARRRLTRAEWKQEQLQAKTLAKQEASAKTLLDQATKKAEYEKQAFDAALKLSKMTQESEARMVVADECMRKAVEYWTDKLDPKIFKQGMYLGELFRGLDSKQIHTCYEAMRPLAEKIRETNKKESLEKANQKTNEQTKGRGR